MGILTQNEVLDHLELAMHDLPNPSATSCMCWAFVIAALLLEHPYSAPPLAYFC